LGLFVVLLMHGEMTCWKFLYDLWLSWCVGATTNKFHNLCDCVHVCKLPMLVGFLWLCQCLQIFVLCDCVDMRKNQQRCISTSCMNDPKKTSLLKKNKKFYTKNKKTLCAIYNEKNHSLLMLGLVK
jgi:hypothetical protein